MVYGFLSSGSFATFPARKPKEDGYSLLEVPALGCLSIFMPERRFGFSVDILTSAEMFPFLVTRWCSSAGQVPPHIPAEISRSPDDLGCLFSSQINFINQISISICFWLKPFFGKGEWSLDLRRSVDGVAIIFCVAPTIMGISSWIWPCSWMRFRCLLLTRSLFWEWHSPVPTDILWAGGYYLSE